MARTKTEESLAAAERAHADDPERAELIGCARRFKASWLELGEALARVRKERIYQRWGFETFDDYAKRELHLRQETADKLCASFLFLEKRAPEVLHRDGLGAPIPSYQAVDFLRRAEEKAEESPRPPVLEAVSEIRRKVIEENAPLPALSRKYREVVFPLEAKERKGRDEQQLRSAAKRLHELLAETELVTRRLAESLTTQLDALLEELGAGDEKAA